jgi:peptidoglycan-associated lipoprotein
MPQPAKPAKPQTGIFHFAYNQYDVAEQDRELLKAHAEYLLQNPDVTINVNGYSDNRGTAKNNVLVSQKRAQHVANLLKSYGVPESQIKVNGYGESFPLNDEKNWDENRRVELQYSDDTESDGLIVSAF